MQYTCKCRCSRTIVIQNRMEQYYSTQYSTISKIPKSVSRKKKLLEAYIYTL